MQTYSYYQKIFKDTPTPFAFVDMDILDQNISAIKQRAGTKKIRIASKSIRSVGILSYILNSDPQFEGLMCYAISEALWLAGLGFDNLLVAYPSVNPAHLKGACEAVRSGKKIYLMTDSSEHLRILNQIAEKEGVVLPICVDIDMSMRFLGIHFGVHRSPISQISDLETYLKTLETCKGLRLVGLMGYEAQLAGLGDNMPSKWLMNRIIRMLQAISLKEVIKRRAEMVACIEKKGIRLEFVNGGGTGSLENTSLEACVTEVAAGSGFYSPTLFDNYTKFKHLPAAGFAVEIVRKPKKDTYTCLGGGYIGSGAIGKEKLPSPYLPLGCTLDVNEGAGEVQTPVYYSGTEKLELGMPIFMRHSKAGELCERFHELQAVRQGQIESTYPTYRGLHKCFV